MNLGWLRIEFAKGRREPSSNTKLGTHLDDILI
jgi:hypothetical protein